MRNTIISRFSSGNTIFSIILVCIMSVQISNAQWVQMNNGMNRIVTSLAYSGNYLFAGTGGSYGVYFSTNNGESWSQSGLVIPSNDYVYSIAVNGNYIFAGTGPGRGVYLSTNNGINWIQTSLNNQHVWALAVNGNTIFAGTQVWGVYLSSDNGTNWIQTSLNNRSIYSLATKGDTVFAGTSGYGVYVSANNGTSWVQTSLNNSIVLSLAVKGDTVFAGTYLNGLYWSSNNGTNWTSAGLSGSSDALEVYGNTIFATVRNSGVYVSINGGSWTLWNEGLGNRIMEDFCIFNNYIFLGTNYSVWRRPISELTGIQPISNEVPNKFILFQNYPNPFNPTTNIKFSIPPVGNGRDRSVKLIVYDILGSDIATLVNEQLKPGTYEVEFDGTNYPSGVYYYIINAGSFSQTKKMVLIK